MPEWVSYLKWPLREWPLGEWPLGELPGEVAEDIMVQWREWLLGEEAMALGWSPGPGELILVR